MCLTLRLLLTYLFTSAVMHVYSCLCVFTFASMLLFRFNNHMSICFFSVYICICIDMYLHVCNMFVYNYIYIYTYIYIYVCMCVCAYM